VDQEVRKIVDQIFDRTVALLQERRDLLERTARRLLEVETLDENELRRLAQPQPRQQDVPGVACIR
jgi:cell division protease FtsH